MCSISGINSSSCSKSDSAGELSKDKIAELAKELKIKPEELKQILDNAKASGSNSSGVGTFDIGNALSGN